jgi:hypothetical protein
MNQLSLMKFDDFWSDQHEPSLAIIKNYLKYFSFSSTILNHHDLTLASMKINWTSLNHVKNG